MASWNIWEKIMITTCCWEKATSWRIKVGRRRGKGGEGLTRETFIKAGSAHEYGRVLSGSI